MRKSYDFSKARKNPHAKRLTTRVTLRIDASTLDWFKQLAGDVGVPYQTLINMYLRDCAAQKKQLRLEWKNASGR